MRRNIISLVAAAVGLSVLAAVPATAGPNRPAGGFTFHGSGYGHGIGMSQYGALGLAKKGWSARRIVRHFYSKVDVGARQPVRPEIRVGLLQSVGSVSLIAAHGAYDLALQSGQVLETVPAGSRRTIEVTADKRFRITRPDGTVVGDTTWGGPSDPVVARRQGDARIRVAEWGHDIGHGELRYEVAEPGAGHLVGVMAVEDYVLGIAEVPSSWPKAALGAQAIAARTYAYWRLAGAMRAGCGCDVFSTVADQSYVGWDKLAAAGGDRWASAVKATERTVATHQGAPIYAAYSSSSGGYTEDIEKVWVGSSALPYLRGVCDPGDDTAVNPSRFWQASFEPGAVASGLKPYTGDIGAVSGFTDWQLGVSGRVTRVTVVGTKGSTVIEGWDIRGGLSLKDTRFSVNRNLNIRGEIRETYDAAGCRPGRAASGQRKVRGGRLQRFVNGRIYEHLRRNTAVWLRGPVLGAYLKAGGPTSRLRLPFRVRQIKGGQRAWFDGGTITCTGGCRVRYR
ncbi:MAG: SpoIID/LytB domain-containing protein [Actinomycetota bacterium]